MVHTVAFHDRPAAALPALLHIAPASPTPATHQLAVTNPDATDPTPPSADPDDTLPFPVAPETTPHSLRVPLSPRDNRDADDLLDEWGHRPFARMLAHRPLAEAPSEDESVRMSGLLNAGRSPHNVAAVPDLHDDDEITVLGSRRGITYGRWIAGPADTLSMSFDLTHAGPAIQQRADFLPLLERAAKAWTRRIHDTWSPWELQPGQFKLQVTTEIDPETPVHVGPEGEISTGLEVHVSAADLPQTVAGTGGSSNRWTANHWEPHFGTLTIDTPFLHRATDPELLAVLIHELGHALGAWGGNYAGQRFTPYLDTETGHWTGPNVMAVHDGPAPFQDALNPFDSHDGERDPAATQYDFAHSGVCASIMAYCGFQASPRAILPASIDFAFLADLGLILRPPADRSETYGLAGWMRHAGFALSVSRELRLDIAYQENDGNSQLHAGPELHVTDLLHAEADAFGHRSTGDIHASYPAADQFGLVRYAGSLIGAAIDLAALPPVTGDASLSVNLETLDGDASFTSLAVHSGGEPEPFAGGALHYPIAIEDNAIVSTDTETALSATFFGPNHEEVAGTLHDPDAALIASFGTTHDTRLAPDQILAEADHLTGLTAAAAADTPVKPLSQHRCTSAASCETRHNVTGDWTDWMSETREQALNATTAHDAVSASKLLQDLDFLRIERIPGTPAAADLQPTPYTAYTGTLSHGAFGTGLDSQSTVWTGAHGTLSGGVPDGPAQWAGAMLGYSHRHHAAATPFVRGRATLDLDLATTELVLTLADVTTVDGLDTLPDFHFDDVRLDPGGTFRTDSQGILAGALLGPNREEAAGSFHHDAALVTGSFGARAVPDTVTLEETGDTRIGGTITDDSGTHSFHSYHEWGVWAKQFDRQLFRALVEQEITTNGDITQYYPPHTAIYGTRSGTNPVSGSAVWNGEVRAFDDHHWTNAAATASAHIEVDFPTATVDVDFTRFDTLHPDMSWRDLPLSAGEFSDASVQPTIEGSFYGAIHQGVAGSFHRDQLRGVFGAVRNDDQ